MNTSRVAGLCLGAQIIVCAGASASITAPTLPAPSTVSCPGTPGWTSTKQLQWFDPAALDSRDYANWLNTCVASQKPAFAGTWNFSTSSNASGSFSITTYSARDGAPPASAGDCAHGATLRVNVTDLQPPAGQEFQWLQIYSRTKTRPGLTTVESQVVDPLSNYKWPPAAPVDALPFYFNVDGRSNWTIPADQHFIDMPCSLVPDDIVPHSGDASFSLLFTSWSGTFDPQGVNTVTIYGRLDWGYTYQCTPAPTVLCLFGVCALFPLRGGCTPSRAR